jgi:multiple sugar transport system substrate-binding protein
VTLHLKQGAYGVQEWLIVLHSLGGSVLSKDLTKVSMGQTATDATQWLVDLIYKHELVSPTDLDSQVEDVVTNMQKGNAAMGIFSSANIYDLDPSVAAEGGTIAYSAPPHGPSVAGGSGVFWAFGLGINKDSKSKDAAWDFIKVVAGKPAQIRMATEAGNGSPRASVYQDASVQAKNSSATATMDALKFAQPKDPHPKWPQIEDALGSELSLALSQKKTADQAMSDASKRIGTIIGA